MVYYVAMVWYGDCTVPWWSNTQRKVEWEVVGKVEAEGQVRGANSRALRSIAKPEGATPRYTSPSWLHNRYITAKKFPQMETTFKGFSTGNLLTAGYSKLWRIAQGGHGMLSETFGNYLGGIPATNSAPPRYQMMSGRGLALCTLHTSSTSSSSLTTSSSSSLYPTSSAFVGGTAKRT